MTAPMANLAVSTVVFALQRDADGARPELRMPVVRRVREPFLGAWALPGGPLDAAEDLETAAARTLTETTGLVPGHLEQLYAFGGVDRGAPDRPRVVSIVYWALVDAERAAGVAADDPNVTWLAAEGRPPLAFDHDEIVDYALWRLRTKLEYAHIAHALIGETFTLAQLREVYEAILGRPLDPANFRRTVEGSGEVVWTGEHLTGTRHRPPKLYRYADPARPADPGPLPTHTSPHRPSEES